MWRLVTIVAMAVAVALSVTLEGEPGVRDGGNSGGDGAGVSVSMSVAVAVKRISCGFSLPLAETGDSSIGVSRQTGGIVVSSESGVHIVVGNVDCSNRVRPVVAGGSVAVRLVGSNGGGGAVAADGNGSRGSRGSINSGKNSAVSGTVTSIAIRAVVGISLSLPLGDVASTNGISDVVTGGSVAVGLVGSDSLHTVSTISSVASVASISDVADVTDVAGVAKTISAVAQAVAVGAVVGVGLGGGEGQATSHNCKSEHLP